MRKTRNVKGAVHYFKRPYILHMKENKPTVFKIQLCRGRVIKEDDFIAYAANAAHVPESTMKTAKHAIFEAINYFVMNGHAVELAGLGSFSPRILSKTTDNPEEVTAELIKRKYIKFNPSDQIKSLCAAENISFEENKALTKQYMNQYYFRMREHEGVAYLVTLDGKLITNGDSILMYDGSSTTPVEDRGWRWVEDDDLVAAWGSQAATLKNVSKTVDGQQVHDYQIIVSGEGELKLTGALTGGCTLSPMPFFYHEVGE